jgi:hypothetical protein
MKKNKKIKMSDKFMDILLEKGLSLHDISDDLKGKAVHIPQVNFDVPLEQKIRASMGLPSYAVRAKYIEDAIDDLSAELKNKYKEFGKSYEYNPDRFKTVWTAVIETLELDKLNTLIKEHNTYYPIEANLKHDPDTGQILMGSMIWKPKKKLTTDYFLEMFPPEIEKALA